MWVISLVLLPFLPLLLLVLLLRVSSSTESRRLKNIDRRSGVSMEVTVGGVTVVVTDYKLKPSSATSSTVSKSRASSDSQSSHDTVMMTSTSPDNHVSHNATSNSVGSPVQSSEGNHTDQD